jgi:hypothetical protein
LYPLDTATTSIDMTANTKPKRLQHFLMSGEEAQKPENILKMFEAIKGRKATPEEIAAFKRKRPVARETKP